MDRGYDFPLRGFSWFTHGMLKLKEVTGENAFTAAGMLLVLSVFVPFLGFISWVAVFMAADRALERLERHQALN